MLYLVSDEINSGGIFIFRMPANIYLNHPCINTMLNLYHSKDTKETEIVFDFSDTTWISGETTPFLGVLLGMSQKLGHNIYSTGINNANVRNILEKNNFLPTYGIGYKANDVHETTIPYTVLNCHDDLAIDTFLDSKVFSLIHKHINENEIEIIRSAVNEISHNIKDHSTESAVYFCGQFYPKKNVIALTLADNGITIPAKIKHKFVSKENDTDHDIINWATGSGNSTKKVASSGLGLFDIKTNIQGIGTLKILSNRGYWEQRSNGEIVKKELGFPYPGTLICLELFNYGHPNRLNGNYNSSDDIITINQLLF